LILDYGREEKRKHNSPLNVLAEPARFWLLGAVCGGPEIALGVTPTIRLKVENRSWLWSEEADTYRDLGQTEVPSSPQDLLRPVNRAG